jgi:uncharacterized protein (TIGR00299 family) protein
VFAYFDIFAGISGDMVLGALVDAGLPLESLQETIAALGLSDEVKVTARKVAKGSLIGTKIDLECRPRSHSNDLPPRRLKEILALLRNASLPAPVQKSASRVFQRLGEVEARLHGIPAEEVHFHEVGALDAIVDIVGAIAGLHTLGVTRVVSSPIPLSRGVVRSSHGTLPIPAPATVALLAGCPIYGIEGIGPDVESVTPTGAAIISTLAESFGPIPDMVLQRMGHGAGSLDLPIPNLLRLLLGEDSYSSSTGLQTESLRLLSTNVDDMPGEWIGPLFDQLLDSGALDVWLTPVQMKKNRPGVVIHLLAEPLAVPSLRLLLLRETTTLGIREETVARWSLPREIRRVSTPWGEVRVKVARLPDGSEKGAPEFEDCKRLAQLHKVPLREVYQSAVQGHLAHSEEKEPL